MRRGTLPEPRSRVPDPPEWVCSREEPHPPRGGGANPAQELSPLREAMLPNFFVIGAAKCGTTSLCTLLGQHPDVFMSDPMEPHYFGRDDPEKTRAWYEGLFDGVEGETAVGEGSTSYTRPDLVERCASEIAAQVPEARLIYMVRDPVRRLESDWKMRKHEGWATEGPIARAVTREDTMLVTQGMYWRNLSHYRSEFAEEQILVVFLEDFAESPREELDRCFAHLGVGSDVDLEEPGRPRNSSSDFRRDLMVGRWLREIGLVELAREVLPDAIFTWGKALLTRPDRYSVRWDPEVKEQVVRNLAGDARRFLEYCGKPADFWALDSPSDSGPEEGEPAAETSAPSPRNRRDGRGATPPAGGGGGRG